MSKTSKKTRRAEPTIAIESVSLPDDVDPVRTVPARALAGWMSDQQMSVFAHGGSEDVEAASGLIARMQRCRAAARSLERIHDQRNLIQRVPPELESYSAEFTSRPLGLGALSEGFEVAVINLAEVVAFQPFVRMASVRNYSLMVTRGDPISAARVALPLDFRSEVRARFDTHRGVWHVFSRDQNLRVVRNVGHPNADGTITVGYNFAVPASLIKVQTYRGRSYLSDGYHRSVALVNKGFSHTLALVREVTEFEQLGAIGHLPFDAFTGKSAPLLRDYWSDAYAIEIKVPRGARHFLLRPEQLS